MNAVRLVQPGQPLEMQQLPTPEISEQDVLVAVKAAGICHSDAHYRAGVSPAYPLPLTLGHEVAGVVEATGSGVRHLKKGDRVCLHYLVTCGHCEYCYQGSEQFCPEGQMIGKHRNGGYAEIIAIPARSAFLLPPEIPFEQGAIMMCSSSTSLHAIRKARLHPGESVAVFGAGGLGISAIQLAYAQGARTVFAVDIRSDRLELAQRLGAVPINASQTDPVAELRGLTAGQGVDVALELIGLPLTMQQAVQSLGVFGRAAIAGISGKPFEISTYTELLAKEAQVIGVSDHLGSEIVELIEFVRQGKLGFSSVITNTVPLEAGAINAVLDALDAFSSDIRTVIVP